MFQIKFRQNQKGLTPIIIVLIVLFVLGLGGWLVYRAWQLEVTKSIEYYANPNTGECLLKPQKNINEELIGKGFDEYVGTKPIDCVIWKCTHEAGLWNQDTLNCICPDKNESFKYTIGCITEEEKINYKSLCENTNGEWVEGGKMSVGEIQNKEVWLPFTFCKCPTYPRFDVWTNANGCQKRD